MVQVAIRTGEADNQAILTLCLLLMNENKTTQSMLREIGARLENISAVQAVHTANLTTFAQVNASNPPAIPSSSRPKNGQQKQPSPPARNLYSAAVKSIAPSGPAAPPPTKKAKRMVSDTRPPPIDCSSMNEQELFFAT